MHRTKDLVNAVLVKVLFILLIKNDFLQVFQKLGILKKIHSQHVVRVKVLRHIVLLSLFVSHF